MRIAATGAHQTGKTTLIDELARSLPTFSTGERARQVLAHLTGGVGHP